MSGRSAFENVQAVVFDWGDTVMVDFPDYSGPMASWPQVRRVEGIEEALRGLHGRYRLALATNGRDSDVASIRRALARVALEGYFQDIFCQRELGLTKSDPAFYGEVLRGLQLPGERVAMVGDHPVHDVVCAKRAGLLAVWFNPAGRPWPLSAGTGPDAQIGRMADLVSLFTRASHGPHGRAGP